MTADADDWSWGLACSRSQMAVGLFGFSLPSRPTGHPGQGSPAAPVSANPAPPRAVAGIYHELGLLSYGELIEIAVGRPDWRYSTGDQVP
jgi:hypothetical protein